MTPKSRDPLTIEVDVSSIKGIQPGKAIEKGGLPRTIRADKSYDQARLNLKIKAVYGDEATECFC
jgi:hypothetical protein